MRGAQVTTVDISPQMVQTVLALGKKYGVELEGIVSSGEYLNVPEGAYDLVYVANTIHHIHDRERLYAQIKPGAQARRPVLFFRPHRLQPGHQRLPPHGHRCTHPG